MSEADVMWRRVADLPFQRLDEETVIVNPAQREVYLLNESASRVWELCASPRTIEDLVAGLDEEYDVSSEVLREAVSNVLVGLLNKRLVEKV